MALRVYFVYLSIANKNIKNGIKHFTFELFVNENKRISHCKIALSRYNQKIVLAINGLQKRFIVRLMQAGLLKSTGGYR